ncbi:MAG: exosortase/archaeosortase family protein [Gemmataceae bacterium]
MATFSTAQEKRGAAAVAGLLGAACLWAYWPTLAGLAHIWATDPQYSYGMLVPLLALILLWQRREKLRTVALRPCWYGVPILALAAAMQAAGAYYYSPWLEQMSLLAALGGLCLSLGGWALIGALALPGAFLLFMVPLPGRFEKLLSGPLQELSTLASTNALQTLGFFAHAEGNVIILRDYELGIVEACSGLRMLMVFLTVSTAVALLIRRSLTQRLLIVASSLPIAVLCNVIRITATGILHETAGHEIAYRVYHDIAGLLMAPMTLAFLALELWLFSRLFVPAEDPAAARSRPRWQRHAGNSGLKTVS